MQLELVHHQHNSALYYDAFDKALYKSLKLNGSGGPPITDHLPVHISFHKIEKTPHIKSYPSWLADSPEFTLCFFDRWTRATKGSGAFGRDKLFAHCIKKTVKDMLKTKRTFSNKAALLSGAIALFKQTQLPEQDHDKIQAILAHHPSLND